MTLPAEVLEELSLMTVPQELLEARSVFSKASGQVAVPSTPLTYIKDRTSFDRAYTINGRGRAKTEDVSGLEALVFLFVFAFTFFALTLG
jgi:hypothetical protein